MPIELKRCLQTLAAHEREIKITYRVRRLGIFGSTARGTARRTSDVDVLVEFSDPPGLVKFIQLENKLSRLLRRRVDLVSRPALKPLLRESILKDVVYVKPRR